jgi:hypothetical protein
MTKMNKVVINIWNRKDLFNCFPHLVIYIPAENDTWFISVWNLSRTVAEFLNDVFHFWRLLNSSLSTNQKIICKKEWVDWGTVWSQHYSCKIIIRHGLTWMHSWSMQKIIEKKLSKQEIIFWK